MIKFSLNGELNKLNVRPTVWKLFLNVLPLNSSIEEWYTRTKSQRVEYKNKIKSLTALKNSAEIHWEDKERYITNY